MTILGKLLLLLMVAAGAPAAAGPLLDATVERTAPATLTVSWHDADPVAVYVADRADATPAQARLISADDRDGRYVADDAGTARRYFLLRDMKDGTVTKVAERLLPLEHGSNFRDIGGYPAAGGKHVRWGLIYRSGATPLLTDADVRQVQALGLRDLIDLRSSEERVLAPTRLDGIRYTAVGYAMAAVMPQAGAPGAPGAPAPSRPGSTLYRRLPTLLAPHLRIIFADLLRHDGPIAYNCSAGQDRTGFVTAMILAALGTPRDAILQDYHLSTGYRHPEYELPKIDTVAQANNPVAMMFARIQQNPAARPMPLKEADGTPFLAGAFDEIESRWGSVDAYLAQEIGLDPVRIAALRAAYLE